MPARQAGSSRSAGETSRPPSSRWAAGSAGTRSPPGRSWTRLLGDQRLDFAFTGLARDAGGRAWARLGAPDGRHAELWVDESYPIIELYTGDTLAPGRRRKGLGTEPMTCPPNAFASGAGVIRLEPGQAVTTTWGARLT